MHIIFYILFLAHLGWSGSPSCEHLFSQKGKFYSQLEAANRQNLLTSLEEAQGKLKELEKEVRVRSGNPQFKTLNVKESKSNLRFLFEKGGAQLLRDELTAASSLAYFSLLGLKVLEEMRHSLELHLKNRLPKTVKFDRGYFLSLNEPWNYKSTWYLRAMDETLAKRLEVFDVAYEYFRNKIELNQFGLLDSRTLTEVSDQFLSIYTQGAEYPSNKTWLKEMDKILEQLKTRTFVDPTSSDAFEINILHELEKSELVKYNSPEFLLTETIFSLKTFDTISSDPKGYKSHDRDAHNNGIVIPTFNFLRSLGLSEFSAALKLRVLNKIDHVDQPQLKGFLYDLLFQIEHEANTNIFKVSSTPTHTSYHNGLYLKVYLTWLLDGRSLADLPIDSPVQTNYMDELKNKNLEEMVRHFVVSSMPDYVLKEDRALFQPEVFKQVVDTLTQFYLEAAQEINTKSVVLQGSYRAEDFKPSTFWVGNPADHQVYASWAANLSNQVAENFATSNLSQILFKLAQERNQLAISLDQKRSQYFGVLRTRIYYTELNSLIRSPGVLSSRQEEILKIVDSKPYLDLGKGNTKNRHSSPEVFNTYETLSGEIITASVLFFFDKRESWILHPKRKLSDKILADVLLSLNKVKIDHSLTREQKVDLFLNAMFGYYNAMPFKRGSAAIGRVYFSGIYLAVFKEKMPDLPDVIDVEAMISNQSEFVAKYRKLFLTL